ncbi:MAG: HD-GYP domain-containing protein [Actinomycetota bacterium]|nr:HD-GYP domain-containing protein [Actinomycetota bacterium]MCL6092990.1 HD-GYP domain-containing protein [Actinomycetota bacterium]MDA8167189.1 HD-GYP domain-containing protein [Actinomycetota bacterium]
MEKLHNQEARIAQPTKPGRLRALLDNRAALAVAGLVAVMALLQFLSNDDHNIQEFLYLGYFIPIAIGARYFRRRNTLFATGCIIVIYTIIFIPRVLIQAPQHNELIIELFGRWGLFAAAGLSLSFFRVGIVREKERALLAERERADRLGLMLEVSNTVASSLKIDQVLQLLAARIVEAVNATFCRISLLSEDGQHIRVIAAHPARNIRWEAEIGMSFPLAELPEHRKAVETKEAVIVGGRRAEIQPTKCQQQLMGDTRSMMIYPLVVGGYVVGLVGIGEQRSWERSPLNKEKADLCQTIVNQGAVAVGHALSHEALEEAFVGTIRSLAEAVDAKDPSTRGHSDWVSKYAVMIGRQLGFDEGAVDVLKYAGYLHDVGKIGIPDTVLGKDGQLTADEWKLMKKHPIVSAKILEPVKITPALKAAVRHHHERFDGKGYPYGLAGESIPLEARIMAVADSYEAMTADRPYRKALTDEEAVGELKRCAGTQFDPACVDAFLRALGRSTSPVIESMRGFGAAS